VLLVAVELGLPFGFLLEVPVGWFLSAPLSGLVPLRVIVVVDPGHRTLR
jgi:hypothetical protein